MIWISLMINFFIKDIAPFNLVMSYLFQVEFSRPIAFNPNDVSKSEDSFPIRD